MAAIGAALMLTAPASAQSGPFTVEGGVQERTWQDTAVPRDTPTPLHKAYKDTAGEIFVATLGEIPYRPAQMLAKTYKMADLARKIADKALDEGQKDAEARLIFVGENATRFTQLIDEGRLPGKDAEATALFRKLGNQFGPDSNSTELTFARDAFLTHGTYALARVGFDELLGGAIKKYLKRLGIKARIDRYGLGRTVSRTWQDEGRMVKKLNRTVWAKLNDRALAVRKFIDDYQNALLDYAIRKLAKAAANSVLDRILDELSDDIRKRHPSDPAPRGEGGFTHTQIRELIQVRPAEMAAIAATPQVAIPVAVPVLAPLPVPAARAPDPVIRSIGVETDFVPSDYFERRSSSSSTSSPSPAPRAADPEPEPPPVRGWSQGGKPNLVGPRIGGSWDGARGRGLSDR